MNSASVVNELSVWSTLLISKQIIPLFKTLKFFLLILMLLFREVLFDFLHMIGVIDIGLPSMSLEYLFGSHKLILIVLGSYHFLARSDNMLASKRH